ncbi:MAG: sulfotransferase domain-containing protein, partial [Phycisphaerae bacterium]
GIARFLGLRRGYGRLVELAAAHRFERLTSRRRGEEDKTAHLRRGIVGDHRNQFTAEQQQRLNDLLAEALFRMGYSSDASEGNWDA